MPVSRSRFEDGWELSQTSVVLLGAGFSAAITDNTLPLMNGFFAGIDPERYPLVVEFIADVHGEVTTANLERVLHAMDQYCNGPSYSRFCGRWGAKRSELQSALEDFVVERLSKPVIKGDNWALSLLRNCGPDTTVISMNFDTLAERVLSTRPGLTHRSESTNCPHCKMRRILLQACECGVPLSMSASEWKGAVLKPHGSIAWRRCRDQGCKSYDCLVPDEYCRPFDAGKCSTCAKDCGPVLMLPSMIKRFNDYPMLGAMWEASQQALEQATSMLVFGFSFPQSDFLLQGLFRTAFQSNPELNTVGIVDCDPDAVANRMFETCTDDREVHVHRFPVVPGERPAWFQRRPDFVAEQEFAHPESKL